MNESMNPKPDQEAQQAAPRGVRFIRDELDCKRHMDENPAPGTDGGATYAPPTPQAPAVAVPRGWKIKRDDTPPFKCVEIHAPNGYGARVMSHERNPANVLYMLAEALLVEDLLATPQAPAEPQAHADLREALANLNAAVKKVRAGYRFGETLDNAILKADMALSSPSPRAAVATQCPRVELVVAVHTLASHFENTLYALRDDAEALTKARGDIAHAMKIAAKHNHNGPVCATPQPPAQPQAHADLLERLKAAVEGECEGLAITDTQGRAILAYLGGLLPVVQPSKEQG
jgi:hypothetical protein